MIFKENVSYCYHLSSIFIRSMSNKTIISLKQSSFQMVHCMGKEIMVSGLGHFVTFKNKSYSNLYIFYFYFCASSTRERDFKQLSRELHGINHVLFSIILKGNAMHFKTKQKQKQENEMFLIFYPGQPVLLLFSFVFLFSFL